MDLLLGMVGFATGMVGLATGKPGLVTGKAGLAMGTAGLATDMPGLVLSTPGLPLGMLGRSREVEHQGIQRVAQWNQFLAMESFLRPDVLTTRYLSDTLTDKLTPGNNNILMKTAWRYKCYSVGVT